MESNYRFYVRRAAEEAARAAKAVTPASQQWHEKLANDFAERAQQFDQFPRQTLADGRWLSNGRMSEAKYYAAAHDWHSEQRLGRT